MIFKKGLSLFVIAVLILTSAAGLIGCEKIGKKVKKALDDVNIVQPVEAVDGPDLMDGITPDKEIGENAVITEESRIAAADFAVRLFKECETEGKNTLVSPLSVMCALSMTANGAAGETLAEMEQTLGMTRDELNTFFAAFRKLLRQESGCRLLSANSVWFRDDDSFAADKQFIQTNADYYGADAYRVPFDASTVEKINRWVDEKTLGMIPELVDSFPGDTVMCLINAMALDAEWKEPYYENEIKRGTFVKEDGTEQTVYYMSSTEWAGYIEDGDAKGFIKDYKGGHYAFVAILPGEGVTVSDYVATLNGEKLMRMLRPYARGDVKVMLPRFKAEYSTELSGTLKKMGMTDPFDPSKADFSLLDAYRNKGVFISRVLHKTFIEVDEHGTRAAAGTMVEMRKGGVSDDLKEVVLNRPFVYMIVDLETNLPIFIGTVNDIAN